MRLALAAALVLIGWSSLIAPAVGIQQEPPVAGGEPITIQRPLLMQFDCPDQGIELLLTEPNGISWTPTGSVEGNIPANAVVKQVVIRLEGAGSPEMIAAAAEIREILTAVRQKTYIPPSQRSSSQRPALSVEQLNQQEYTGSARPGQPASNWQDPAVAQRESPQAGSGAGLGAAGSSVLANPPTTPSFNLERDRATADAGAGLRPFWSVNPTDPGAGTRADSTLTPAAVTGGNTQPSWMNPPPAANNPAQFPLAGGVQNPATGNGFANPGVANPGALSGNAGALSGAGQTPAASQWPQDRGFALQPRTNLFDPVTGAPLNGSNPASSLTPVPGSVNQNGTAWNGSAWNPNTGAASLNPAATAQPAMSPDLLRLLQENAELRAGYQRQQDDLRLVAQRNDLLESEFQRRAAAELSGDRFATRPDGGTGAFPTAGVETGGAQWQTPPAARLADQRSLASDTAAAPITAQVPGPENRGSGTTPQQIFLLWLFLAASIGLNIYLGLVAHGLYMRYGDLADELRETFTTTA